MQNYADCCFMYVTYPLRCIISNKHAYLHMYYSLQSLCYLLRDISWLEQLCERLSHPRSWGSLSFPAP